jgi:hypothetical protein
MPVDHPGAKLLAEYQARAALGVGRQRADRHTRGDRQAGRSSKGEPQSVEDLATITPLLVWCQRSRHTPRLAAT